VFRCTFSFAFVHIEGMRNTKYGGERKLLKEATFGGYTRSLELSRVEIVELSRTVQTCTLSKSPGQVGLSNARTGMLEYWRVLNR